MKPQSLVILIIAIAIGGLAYYLSTSSTKRLAGDDSYLLPGLLEKLNDVTGFTILKANNTLLAAVSKSANSWVVDNRAGYEADFMAVRTLINNLAQARLIESKTSNPDNYSKLGIEDISNANAQGVQISIDRLDTPVNIIVGNKGSTGKNSQYIRRTSDQQSWLMNKHLDINREASHWLRKDIFDIPPEHIKSVSIQHPDGTLVRIENEGNKDYDFALINVLPEGKQISESDIYQVANALSSLQLRDVYSLKNLPGKEIKPVITSFSTYDGLNITARTFLSEQQSYTVFEVEVDTNQIGKSKTTEEFVTNIAPRIEGWGYELPTITQNAMVKKLESFFLAKETE